MRIISQDGSIDFPYENSCIFIFPLITPKLFTIRIQMAGDTDTITQIATYSTEENALKAMEMLRNAYAGKFITNVDIPDDLNEMLNTAMKGGFGTVVVKDTCERVEFSNLNGYFQFPAEEELEEKRNSVDVRKEFFV